MAAAFQHSLTSDEADAPCADQLPPGTRLFHDQYVIERFLNAGGFGITYVARDSLERQVVVKECFPAAFCRRTELGVTPRSPAHGADLKTIVRLFMQEARSLARLDHPNIVGVHQVFEDNNTAYMVLDFVEGRDLLDLIEDPSTTLAATQVRGLLDQLLQAVAAVHDAGLLHRDISPDNIQVDAQMRPVLIDFGAARGHSGQASRMMSALRVVKDGYSPQELYAQGSAQQPCSDLYALAAVFYHLIAGEVPPQAQTRLAAVAGQEPDPYVPLHSKTDAFDRAFTDAIDQALQILPRNRIQTAQQWRTQINTRPRAQAGLVASRAAPTIESPIESTVARGVKAKQDATRGASQHNADVIPLRSASLAQSAEAPPLRRSLVDRVHTDHNDAPKRPRRAVPLLALAGVVSLAALLGPWLLDGTRATAPAQNEGAPAPQAAATLISPSAPNLATDPRPDRKLALVERPSLSTRPRSLAGLAAPQAPDLALVAAPGFPTRRTLPSHGLQDLLVSFDPGATFAPQATAQLFPSTAWRQLPPLISAVMPALLPEAQSPGQPPAVDTTLAMVPSLYSAKADLAATVRDTAFTAAPTELVLGNGLRFTVALEGKDWVTRVASAAEDATSTLQPGDRLLADFKSQTPLDAPDSLAQVIRRQMAQGETEFTFAVAREDGMWVASMAYAAEP